MWTCLKLKHFLCFFDRGDLSAFSYAENPVQPTAGVSGGTTSTSTTATITTSGSPACSNLEVTLLCILSELLKEKTANNGSSRSRSKQLWEIFSFCEAIGYSIIQHNNFSLKLVLDSKLCRALITWTERRLDLGDGTVLWPRSLSPM